MKSLLKLGIILFLAFSISGCVAFLVGAGVIGGVAISEDTVESYVDRDFDALWKISIDVIERIGVVTEKDKDKGLLKGVVEKSAVTVKLEEISQKTTRLKISARRLHKLLPNIKMATKLNNRIAIQAARGWR